MTPEKITPQKKVLPDISKVPKIDLGVTYYDQREYDSHPEKCDS